MFNPHVCSAEAEVRSLQNSAENDKLMIHGSMKALKDGEEFLNKQLTEMEELRYNLLYETFPFSCSIALCSLFNFLF